MSYAISEAPLTNETLRAELLRVRDELDHQLDRYNPGEQLSWWVSAQGFRIPARATERLAECGRPLAEFFRVANDLFYRHAWIRERLEKRFSPHYAILNRCQPDALPRLIRPDVVCAADWNPKLVELEITVGARADTALMALQYGRDRSKGLIHAYGRMVKKLRGEGRHLALVTAPHPFFQDLPDDARAFAAMLEEDGAGPITLITAENLAQLRFDGDRLTLCHRYGPPRVIDVIDRFIDIYEIAELQHPGMGALFDAYAAGAICDINTCKQFLDEKDWMSLFWEPALRPEWLAGLGAAADGVLRELIPRTWIVRPGTVVALPDGEDVPLDRLAEVAAGRRRFVVKESGTSTTASGAQSLYVLHEMNPHEVHALLARAARGGVEFVIQELIESPRVPFWAIDPATGEVVHQPDARLKLSPFFVDGELSDIRFVASNRKYAVNDGDCVVGIVDF